MVKVFEINEHDRRVYPETYEVKFTYKDGEFWKQGSKIYCTASKGRHDQVQKRFEKDMQNIDYRLINITYQ